MYQKTAAVFVGLIGTVVGLLVALITLFQGTTGSAGSLNLFLDIGIFHIGFVGVALIALFYYWKLTNTAAWVLIALGLLGLPLLFGYFFGAILLIISGIIALLPERVFNKES